MAVVQTAANKRGMSNIAQKDSGGYYYVQFGKIRLYQGAGSPNGIITAPIGSKYTDTTTSGTEYHNTDGATTWQTVTQS